MNHPFTELMPEYVKLLSTVRVRPDRAQETDRVARKLLGALCFPRYKAVQDRSGVPALWIAPVDERESNANPRLGLGQGDPWGEVSRHVPRGCGPFPDWSTAAVFYLHRNHVDDNSHAWALPYACWKWESWNGFGPRARGIHTGYLWGGTFHYSRGKYVADGVWDAEHEDMQLGTVPVALRMMEIEPALVIPGMPGRVQAPMAPPAAPPVGVGAPIGEHDTKWLQAALNRVLPLADPLVVDGNYGRLTRTAVWDYQKTHGLAVDGLFGPETDASLARVINGS